MAKGREGGRMKEYSVTVELTFSISARNEERAQERAQEVVDSITVGNAAKWLGDVEFGDPDVTEDA